MVNSDATIKSWLLLIRTTTKSHRLLANGTLPPIITQMFEFKFFLLQKLSPHSTTPPSPRAPPCSRRNGLRGICSVVHISFVHVSCQLALLCQRSQSNKISLATDLVRSSPTPNPFNWPLTSLFQLYKCLSKAASSPCSTQRARINFFSSNKDNVCTQFHEIIIPPFLVIVDNG